MTGKKSNVLFWTLAVTALALTLLLAGLSASHFLRTPPAVDDGRSQWQLAQKAIVKREFAEAALDVEQKKYDNGLSTPSSSCNSKIA